MIPKARSRRSSAVAGRPVCSICGQSGGLYESQGFWECHDCSPAVSRKPLEPEAASGTLSRSLWRSLDVWP